MPTHDWIQRLQTTIRDHRGPARRRGIQAGACPAGTTCAAAAELLEDRTLLTAYVVDAVADDPLTTATDTDGLVSLREAIQAANTNAAFGDAAAGNGGAVDTIAFAPSLSGQTIVLGGAELTISDDLTVTGLGADDLTISGNNVSRVILVEAGVTTQLAGLTIANGSATDGGGIYNLGILTVNETVLTNNTAQIDGGAIDNLGSLAVTNSTLSNNWATYGGAIVSWSLIIESPTLTISGSTLSNNYADFEGGGVWSDGVLDVADTTFLENSSWSRGAGIRTYGTATVSESTFTSNAAGGNGGGISNGETGALTVINSTFTENSGSVGGAIDSSNSFLPDQGMLDVIGSTFVRNTAGAGGAIWDVGDSNIVDSTFSENIASGWGGALANSGNSMVVRRSTFINNDGGSFSGAIDNTSFGTGSTLKLYDSTLAGNTARREGGAIENLFGTMEIVNTTISGNATDGDGGGIWNLGTMAVTNSTITGNRADADGDGVGSGGGIFDDGSSVLPLLNNTIVAGNLLGSDGADSPDDIFGLLDPLSVRNLIGDADTSGGLIHGGNGNIVGNVGIGTIDITTVLDTALADNGGPTLTHALVAGSLAIDAGDNSLISATTDQTGSVRILDGNGDGIATIDIGALELVTTFGILTLLADQIDGLGEVGLLNFGEESSLLTLLTQAWNQYEAQNTAGSTSLMEAFLRRVQNLRDRGVLDFNQVESLISVAEQLLVELETG